MGKQDLTLLVGRLEGKMDQVIKSLDNNTSKIDNIGKFTSVINKGCPLFTGIQKKECKPFQPSVQDFNLIGKVLNYVKQNIGYGIAISAVVLISRVLG